MQFSVALLPLQHPLQDEFADQAFVQEFCQTAEVVGFAGVHVTEHPAPAATWLAQGGHDSLDPFVALAFGAGSTRSLRLLTNLTVVPYRNPFLLAKAAASLDRLSGGRLTLGVGTGYLKSEYFALGIDFEERNVLFDEAIEACRHAWSGEVLTIEGQHFSARACQVLPVPLQDPLPVWIGGNSRLSRRRAATIGQGWIPMVNTRHTAAARRTPPLEDLTDLRSMIADVCDQAAAAGRTEALDIMFTTFAEQPVGARRWDPDADVADIQAQAEAGVTWQAVNMVAATPDEAIGLLRTYATAVIGRVRPPASEPAQATV